MGKQRVRPEPIIIRGTGRMRWADIEVTSSLRGRGVERDKIHIETRIVRARKWHPTYWYTVARYHWLAWRARTRQGELPSGQADLS